MSESECEWAIGTLEYESCDEGLCLLWNFESVCFTSSGIGLIWGWQSDFPICLYICPGSIIYIYRCNASLGSSLECRYRVERATEFFRSSCWLCSCCTPTRLRLPQAPRRGIHFLFCCMSTQSAQDACSLGQLAEHSRIATAECLLSQERKEFGIHATVHLIMALSTSSTGLHCCCLWARLTLRQLELVVPQFCCCSVKMISAGIFASEPDCSQPQPFPAWTRTLPFQSRCW